MAKTPRGLSDASLRAAAMPKTEPLLHELRRGDLVELTWREPGGSETTVTGWFQSVGNGGLILLTRSSDGADYQVSTDCLIGLRRPNPEVAMRAGQYGGDLGPVGEPVVFGHSPLTVVFYGAYGTAYAWSANPSSPTPSLEDMALVDRAVLRAMARDIIARLDRAEEALHD